MGKTVISGTFTGTGFSGELGVKGGCSVIINNGVGTVQIERSHDQGQNYLVISKNSDGDAASYVTADDMAFNGLIDEPMFAIMYRLQCTAYTSGNIAWRLASSQ